MLSFWIGDEIEIVKEENYLWHLDVNAKKSVKFPVYLQRLRGLHVSFIYNLLHCPASWPPTPAHAHWVLSSLSSWFSWRPHEITTVLYHLSTRCPHRSQRLWLVTVWFTAGFTVRKLSQVPDGCFPCDVALWLRSDPVTSGAHTDTQLTELALQKMFEREVCVCLCLYLSAQVGFILCSAHCFAQGHFIQQRKHHYLYRAAIPHKFKRGKKTALKNPKS